MKSKKLKELLNIIEEVKSDGIKNSIIEKRKVNFMRSQVYKSNTPTIFKTL